MSGYDWSTDELLRQLHDGALDEVLQSDASLPPFPDRIAQMCLDRGEARGRVIRRAGIERGYGYQLFSGTRKPSRDKVIQLAFGFALGVRPAGVFGLPVRRICNRAVYGCDPAFAPASGVTFDESLIEQAVRLALGKGEDEPIQGTDLLSVTELYIYGDQTAEDVSGFKALGEHMARNDGVLKNGGIHFLSDLVNLKNLKILCIALEDIADLSPLVGLEALEKIDLRQNPVEDISPLASLPALRELYLYETRVSDLSPLSACAMLQNVDAGKTRIASMAAFRGMESMRSLSMMDTPLQMLSGVESFPRLEEIRLSNVADGDLRPLLALPQLKEAYLAEALRQAAKEQLEGAAFTVHDS